MPRASTSAPVQTGIVSWRCEGSFPGRPSSMKNTMIRDQESIRAWILACFLLYFIHSSAPDLSPEQIIAAFADEQARNKAALLEYTWQQQEIILIKDRFESQRLFQVEVGSNGRTEKMPMDLPEETSSSSQKEERGMREWVMQKKKRAVRSEEHTSELQSRLHLVCRLL